MTYHVSPSPRHIPRTWGIWLLWIGGISSCIIGLFHRAGFRKPLSGPLHILGDSVIASELGIMLLLVMLVFIGIVAATTRFWRSAWGCMLIMTAILMPLCLVVASHTERLIRRFEHTFPAPWAEDAARIPWLMVGGTGGIMLACVMAFVISILARKYPPLPQRHPVIRIEYEGHDHRPSGA
ncbi:hypothetical protein [Herpetosiphon gulosus]|uniref:Uncharacterized protein n=1 Tax=Herpetosiphon gulosus TaxID=1973496 RepID=A0ABP9X6N6_9CHLR